MIHKKKDSLVPLMDEAELGSSGFSQDSESVCSTSGNQDSIRPCSSPTFLTRRYQKSATELTVSSSPWTDTSASRQGSLCGRMTDKVGTVDGCRISNGKGTFTCQPATESEGIDSIVRNISGMSSLVAMKMSVDGAAATVTCTDESILIQYDGSGRCQCFGAINNEDIPFNEILATDLSGPKKSCWYGYPFPHNMFEMCLYTFDRSARNSSAWFPRKVLFKSPAEKLMASFHGVVQNAIQKYACRPQNLLILINPYGGSKRAQSVYEQNVLPVLEKARIQFSTLMTKYRGHAKDIISNLSVSELEELDGIVAVGGDGLFHEIANALLVLRSEEGSRAEHAENINVGHIPAGSTDAVACTLNGTRSAFTAAMHIALGHSVPLDVLRIDSHEGSTEYAISMASYGFMGDLMEASERMRWMGPIRYEVVGAQMLAANKSYHATVEYLPAPKSHGSLSSRVCTRDCLVCSQPSHGRLNSAHKSFRSHAQESLSRFPQEWKKTQGEYSGIMLVIMPCRSEKSSKGVAKYGHLYDGNVHLVLVKKCSRWQYLRFLMRLSSHGLDAENIDNRYVELIHVVAVKITHSQHPEKNSIWNIDGELLKCSGIVAESHRGAIRVFSRGIEID